MTEYTTLSVAEESSLTFMREEEKLARDVYMVLYEQWGLKVFNNISQSEQSHIDSVATIMAIYDVADTASSEDGVFTNTDLQDLYLQLVSDGEASLIAALEVGALIEEVDINDLNNAIETADNPDVF